MTQYWADDAIVRVTIATISGITETEEELHSLVKKSKDLTEKDGLRMLLLLKSGKVKNRVEVAQLLGMHRGTIGGYPNMKPVALKDC